MRMVARIRIVATLLVSLAVGPGRVTNAAEKFACPQSQTPPLTLQGKRFYDSSTDQYVPIQGIAYYPRPNAGELASENNHDYLTDDFQTRWEADIATLQTLGVNAVRIYAVDPSKNHDAFMCALQAAGIYVTVGLLADCAGCGIGAWVGVDAEPPLCYPASVKARGQMVINAFAKYDNVFAFSAGNEVTIYADDGTTNTPRQINAPCQKKFVRDMRHYVAACSRSRSSSSSDNEDAVLLSRAIPIGLENWDGDAEIFEQNVYYHCQTDPNDILENIEWFGINAYRHCNGAAVTPAEIGGWTDLHADFAAANFPGPILFGEYGCRNPSFPTLEGFEAQRTWLQTEALYSASYNDVFAGGFVFEFSAEKQVIDDNLAFMDALNGVTEPSSVWPYQNFAKDQHGIGYFTPVDCDSTNTVCQYVPYPEFQLLAAVLATTDDTTTLAPQAPGIIPVCPEQFPSLLSIEWPTDAEEDVAVQACLATTAPSPPTAAPSVPKMPARTTEDATTTDAPTTTTLSSDTTQQPTTMTETETPVVLRCSSFCHDDRWVNGERHCLPGDMADQCGFCDYCNASSSSRSTVAVQVSFVLSLTLLPAVAIIFVVFC